MGRTCTSCKVQNYRVPTNSHWLQCLLPAMFPCNQCQRSYASQNSLTRHVHSHETSIKHQCAVCGVIFYRKDLLSRHSKLHTSSYDEAIPPASPATTEHLGAGGGRRRCHTACLRCRDLRTKCDGQRPCLTCQGANHSCIFPPPANRLSRISTDLEEVPEPNYNSMTSASLPEHMSQHSFDLDQTSGVLAGCNFEGAEAFMADMEGWPWMHENLYLPTDMSFFANLEDPLRPQISGGDPTASEVPETDVDAFSIPRAAQHPTKERAVTTPGPLQAIQELLSFATASNASCRSHQSRAQFWSSMSNQISEAFACPQQSAAQGQSLLHYFGTQYVQHFGTLWPLLSPQTLDLNALHPQLFLVITSIGAMYCGSAAGNYGVMMHTKIRRSLINALDLEEDDCDLTWLAQARLLTQVAALYFGQPRAFTYAQHIGALLVAQARKMDLFSANYMLGAQKKLEGMKSTASDRDRLAVWLQMEARRRLAFGIFRGDTYTSVLLHTKPLISLEEIDLQFPMCDTVWRGEKMEPSLCLQMIDNDHTFGRDMWASDIYHIALDRNETLPPLDPPAHELLMFGLQYPVWRFSRDQNRFRRLLGNDGIDEIAHLATRNKRRRLHGTSFEHETYRVDSATRHMDDLKMELERLKSALEKWEHALPLVKTFARTSLEKSSLMSGLLLFHLSYLRLDAPLGSLHQIQYRLVDHRSVDNDSVMSVREWTRSTRGRRASQRACDIWSMISREASNENSIKFNLLAFIGLHHGAVLLWAYAGGHDTSQSSNVDEEPLALADPERTVISKLQSSDVLRKFVGLYDKISSGRWSSFAQAAEALMKEELPEVNHQ